MKKTIQIDEARREVFVNNKPVTLAHREFDLCVYMSKAGRVVTRGELKDLFGFSEFADKSSVDVQVYRLRKKLPPGSIATLNRVGYRWDA